MRRGARAESAAPLGAPSESWANSASSKTRASSVFSSAASWGGTKTPHRAMPCSMRRITVSMTSTRPLRLFSDEMTSHGASGPFVKRSMSETGCVVLRPLLTIAPVLLRQLPGLERIVAAPDEPAQLLLVRHVHPELDHDHALLGQRVLEVGDLLVGAAPLHLGGQVLDPLDQDPPVPAAVEDGHAAPSGKGRPEAPQEVVAQLVGGRCGKGRDVDVPGVERLDQPLDGAALAGGVPPLEDDAHRRPELALVELPAVDQPEVQQAALRPAEAFALLVLGQLAREVGVLQFRVVVGRGPGGRPVVIVSASASRAVVMLHAHVACCSRSTGPRRHQRDRGDGDRWRPERRGADRPDHPAHQGRLAGDDQQLLVGKVAHPADLAAGRVEDANAGTDVSSRVEGERRHRTSPRQRRPTGVGRRTSPRAPPVRARTRRCRTGPTGHSPRIGPPRPGRRAWSASS